MTKQRLCVWQWVMHALSMYLWYSKFISGYLSEENENTSLKRYMHTYVHCSIIYNNNLSAQQQMNG